MTEKNMQEEGDPEKRPLLQPVDSYVSASFDEKFCSSYTFDPNTGTFLCDDDGDLEDGINDTMSYNTEILTSWSAFSITYTTVWVSRDLWLMMAKLLGVSILVCVITVAAVPNPEAMKVAKFTQVSKFLNVVTGLLLGFFLSSSMNRWYACVNGFLELLDAIRNLQMQFTALGVPEDGTNLCLRYGFASAWLLYGQLLLETKQGTEVERASMWKTLGSKKAPLQPQAQGAKEQKLLTQEEIAFLQTTRDPPGIMFMWIAALIGNLAQEGWIPGMPTPTYGRIMNLCQDGHAGIRQVRASVSVQAPLNYSHMLATLVHLNNLLNAITLGIVGGIALGCNLVANNWHYYSRVRSSATMARESEQDLQNLLITTFYCTLGPLLYQALLTIGMHLAQPFNAEDARMPLHRLLHQLEVDIHNGHDSKGCLPFAIPAFKKQ